jgi:hypothetical protein
VAVVDAVGVSVAVGVVELDAPRDSVEVEVALGEGMRVVLLVGDAVSGGIIEMLNLIPMFPPGRQPRKSS